MDKCLELLLVFLGGLIVAWVFSSVVCYLTIFKDGKKTSLLKYLAWKDCYKREVE